MKKILYLILLIPIISISQTLKSFESSDGTEIFYDKDKLLSGGPGKRLFKRVFFYFIQKI